MFVVFKLYPHCGIAVFCIAACIVKHKIKAPRKYPEGLYTLYLIRCVCLQTGYALWAICLFCKKRNVVYNSVQNKQTQPGDQGEQVCAEEDYIAFFILFFKYTLRDHNNRKNNDP